MRFKKVFCKLLREVNVATRGPWGPSEGRSCETVPIPRPLVGAVHWWGLHLTPAFHDTSHCRLPHTDRNGVAPVVRGTRSWLNGHIPRSHRSLPYPVLTCVLSHVSHKVHVQQIRGRHRV